MAGLLDGIFNTEQGRMGLGLLAAGSARGDGAGFGQRLSEAVGSVDQWKQQQAQAKRMKMQEEFQAFQMQQAMAQAEQQKKMQALAGQFRTPAVGMAADGFGPSTPAGFDREGYASALETIDPIAGLQYAANIQKQGPKLTAYKPGDSVRDDSGREVFSVPQEVKQDNTDAKIKQYEYAQKNGYKGSFEQFVTLGPTIMAAAQAPLRDAQTRNIVDENAYNLPPPAPTRKPSNAPMRGQVVQGYKFKGGDPAVQSNWEKQ